MVRVIVTLGIGELILEPNDLIIISLLMKSCFRVLSIKVNWFLVVWLNLITSDHGSFELIQLMGRISCCCPLGWISGGWSSIDFLPFFYFFYFNVSQLVRLLLRLAKFTRRHINIFLLFRDRVSGIMKIGSSHFLRIRLKHACVIHPWHYAAIRVYYIIVITLSISLGLSAVMVAY